MYRLSTSIAGALCAVMIMTATLQTATVSAATINNADIREQTIQVQVALVETLREHVKLLQMIMIQRLENRVATLQARL